MRQRATVEEVIGNMAEVAVLRESACSGDCHKCAGCGAVKQTVRVCGENLIGARKGDKVYVESATGTVLWAAVLVYLGPLVGFFAGYFLGLRWGPVSLCSVAGFAIGWIPALCYNAHVKKKPPVYRLVAFVESEWKA